MSRSLQCKAMAVVLCLVMVWTGCSASWINTALADIPVVIQIISSVSAIVAAAQGKGQADPVVLNAVGAAGAKATAALQAAQQLYNDYKAAEATAKPGIAGQIDSALTTAKNNLNTILDVAQVKDQATRLTITSAVGLAITTVVAFQSLIPLPATGTKMARVPQQPPSPSALKTRFNDIVKAQYPAAQLR